MRNARITLSAATVALALSLAACGGSGDGDTAERRATTTTERPATSTSAAPAPSTTAAPASTTAPSTATPASTGVGTGDLPGEPFDLYPYEGASLAVVGVDRDDVLNLRTAPGTDAPVAYAMAPTVTGLIASGQNRTLPDGSIWAEVSVEGHGGWANVAFLGQPGATTDITAELDGRPVASTPNLVAQAVAQQRASEEPPSKVVVIDGPVAGDSGTITVDVIGLGDDAQLGERLAVQLTPSSDGTNVTIGTVRATALCARGVTDDGLCV